MAALDQGIDLPTQRGLNPFPPSERRERWFLGFDAEVREAGIQDISDSAAVAAVTAARRKAFQDLWDVHISPCSES